jgi:hypothetical protein
MRPARVHAWERALCRHVASVAAGSRSRVLRPSAWNTRDEVLGFGCAQVLTLWRSTEVLPCEEGRYSRGSYGDFVPAHDVAIRDVVIPGVVAPLVRDSLVWAFQILFAP